MKYWIFMAIATFICCTVAMHNSVLKTEHGYKYIVPGRISSVIACIILILFSGLRRGIGDTGTYKHSFEMNISNNVSEFFLTTDFQKDWGFNLFQTILKSINENPQFMIFICSLITIVCLFWVYYKYSDSLQYSIFYFITSGAYLTSMNGIRQYIVSAILFAAFPLVVKRKFYLYFPLVLIMSTFHQSALIFIPLYFICNQKAWGTWTVLLLLGGIGLYISYPITGPIIADLIGETQYSEYSTVLLSTGEGANIIRAIVNAVPLILCFLGRRNKELNSKKGYDLVVNMSVLNLIFMLLANKYWIYARFNMYFSLYSILLLTWCIDNIFEVRSEKIVRLLSVILYILFFLYEMYGLGFTWNTTHFI